MKKKTLQWQLTLLTALLAVCACLTVSALISRSAIVYLDKVENAVVRIAPNDGDDAKAYLEYKVEVHKGLEEDAHEARKEFWRDSLIATVLVAILCSVLTYVLIGRQFRPLRELEEKVATVQGKNILGEIVVDGATGEVRQLTEAFNEMMRRIAVAFQKQRRFSANAAHELRTPLAVMQTKMEVLQKQAQPTMAEYEETLEMIRLETAHLSEVVATILQMADLQSKEYSERISLREVIEEVLCDLTSPAEKRRISLRQLGGEAEILGNDTLVYRAIYNLVENAIKYNSAGGEVTVEILPGTCDATGEPQTRDGRAASELSGSRGASAVRATSDGEPTSPQGARVRITDTGIGLSQDAREKVFEAFYRVNKTSGHEAGGAGLGLTLVREIMRLHNGSVRIVKSDESGTQFELVFGGVGEE